MNRRLKILFLASWYPTRESPYWAPFVREHAKAAALYHDVVVLGPPVRNDQLKSVWTVQEETDPAVTYGIPTYHLQWRKIPIPKLSFAPYYWSVVAGFLKLWWHGFKPDIIHLQIFELGRAAIWFGRLFNIPVVVSEHTTLFPEKRLSPAELSTAKFTFERAAMVLPDARSLQRAIQDCGIRARFQFIPNVASTELFFPPMESGPRDVIRMLFVGRLSLNHVKGMPYLIEALKILSGKRNDWCLDVIGDGPARAEYERQFHELGLLERICFFGTKSLPEIAEHMRSADLFVLPSLWENFPCVVVEALASGLPIVATRVGDVPEMVHETTGRVVPPRDAPALADALLQMLERLPQFDRHAIAQTAQSYSPAAVGAALDNVYRSVL